jgi:hypothetical protein
MAEVQRTLVKSPPELWAELSDPASLARHLSSFGEVRTTRIEPETTVEWEAQDVRGTVQLDASGWGTKVTLSVVRETPDPPDPDEPPIDEQMVAELELQTEPVPEPPSESEQEPEVVPEHELRIGLWARIFRRLRKRLPVGEVEVEVTEPELEGTEPEPVAVEMTEPGPVAEDLAAELARVEAEIAEQDSALLAAVLDRLGAAHHRPFSRA